jgi:hypothetical protein
LHSGGAGSFLHEPGLISDQYAIGVAEPVEDVLAEVIVDFFGVPVGGV